MSAIDRDTLILYVSNLSASTLSLLGAGAIMVNYLFYTNKSQILYKLIFFLSLADFFGSLFIFVSQSLLFGTAYYALTYSHGLCIFFRAGINLFFVSSFLWTVSISIHIWVCAQQRAQIPILFFHLVSWGLSAVMTLVLIGGKFIEVEPDTHWCHPDPIAKWLLWFTPLVGSFLCNSLFYFLSIRRFKVESVDVENSRDIAILARNVRQKKLQWKIKKRLTLYLLVFALCWIWDVVNQILRGFNIEPPYILVLLQSIFSPMQGFLNFLVYGMNSRMFKSSCCGRETKTQMQEKQRLKASLLNYQAVN
eukprot:TRINITY_DN7051_c0_g1_i1.p1 TRINITY_DN7051_c0_g1~~TRINITY_DN7051_c0_g1_i1.p1  ORF type:complete len:307 (-),score=9.09 TRINITY_DN7051_c0_g1_i1:150-1070(-)